MLNLRDASSPKAQVVEYLLFTAMRGTRPHVPMSLSGSCAAFCILLTLRQLWSASPLSHLSGPLYELLPFLTSRAFPAEIWAPPHLPGALLSLSCASFRGFHVVSGLPLHHCRAHCVQYHHRWGLLWAWQNICRNVKARRSRTLTCMPAPSPTDRGRSSSAITTPLGPTAV